jgi:hypothetical protein
MQIEIVNGVYSDKYAQYRTSYPINLIPVVKAHLYNEGAFQGYLKQADGLSLFCECAGIDRGGINWNGVLYRVIGDGFYSISQYGDLAKLGTVASGNDYASFDYSFDRLGISCGGFLYYYTIGSFTKVIDVDLGYVKNHIWVDGYFMTTDGVSLVVTELNDPSSINPLKYGSSETDPDEIQKLLKIRNEVHSVGRYTIEVFSNVGGSNFPFQRISGALANKGAIGKDSCCVLNLNTGNVLAFLGSGKNEPSGVYFYLNGGLDRVSTLEIDSILQSYSEKELSECKLESRHDKNNSFLYVHLKDKTLVYDASSSKSNDQPIWFILTSSLTETGIYKARNFVWCYDKWIFGDPTLNRIGYFDDSHSNHFGEINGWQFATPLIYNKTNNALVYELELVCLTGEIQLGLMPTISTSYSIDGRTWSIERFKNAGKTGSRSARLRWLQNGQIFGSRIQKFVGNSDVFVSISKLEARIEPLRV